MLDAAQKAVSFCGAMSAAEFAADDKTAFAVIHALAILGEAAKHVPAHVRDKKPEIPFRIAAAMRDKLILDYFGVRRERLWQTVQTDLPPLIAGLRRILDGR